MHERSGREPVAIPLKQGVSFRWRQSKLLKSGFPGTVIKKPCSPLCSTCSRVSLATGKLLDTWAQYADRPRGMNFSVPVLAEICSLRIYGEQSRSNPRVFGRLYPKIVKTSLLSREILSDKSANLCFVCQKSRNPFEAGKSFRTAMSDRILTKITKSQSL